MNQLPQSDHDLLITLVEKVSNLQADVKQYNNGTDATLQDHEGRLRAVEASFVSWPKVLAAVTTLGVILGGLWWLVK